MDSPLEHLETIVAESIPSRVTERLNSGELTHCLPAGRRIAHGVRQVDRLLSNQGVDVWTFFEYWAPYIVGVRTEVVVVLDWRSFAADGQDTIVLSMVTGHGRATPLLWKTVAPSTLKGNQRRYEYELLVRLREVVPADVTVTDVADRGFADCKPFYALTTELALST